MTTNASSPEAPVSLSMTEKQLFQSVVEGRRITFHVFDGDPVSGYLAGMDSERLFILEPTEDGFSQKFVSRTGNGTPVFEIHEKAVYTSEACHLEMEQIIAPFRGWISNNVRGRRTQRTPRRTPRRSERAIR